MVSLRSIVVVLAALAAFVVHGAPLAQTQDGHDLGASASNQDVVIKPMQNTTGLPAIGLVMIQGADIATEQYSKLAVAIQAAMSKDMSVAVAIPAFPLKIPEPLLMNASLNRAVDLLQNVGLPSAAPLVGFAHSLGTVMLQQYIVNTSSTPTQHVQFEALVLTGGSIMRQYRGVGVGQAGAMFPIPVLTVDGELDGLYRIARQAESFNAQAGNTSAFPVFIVPGMNHMQFASGAPPPTVLNNDLKPEISNSSAHKQVADLCAAYLTTQLDLQRMHSQQNTQASVNPRRVSAARAILASAQNDTKVLLQPLVDALSLEANPHFVVPCNTDWRQDFPRCRYYPRYPGLGANESVSNPPGCMCGNAWSEQVSMPHMAGPTFNLSQSQIISTDGIHNVSDTHPIHLPHVWSKCNGDNSTCVVNVTTVTESTYNPLDAADSGFFPESALELRTKLMSRQSMLLASGLTPAQAPLNVTDAPSICSEINAKSIAWAWANAPARTRTRFSRVGQPLVVGPDLGPYNAGPLWINHELEFNEAANKTQVVVQAPMMKTPYNFIIPLAAGYHYCKILSPARALEWLYTDGLRAFDSLNSSSERQRQSLRAVASNPPLAHGPTTWFERGGQCPDMSSLRTTNVAKSFDDRQLNNTLLYLQAFMDAAETGATCQNQTNTVDSTTGVITMALHVQYGSIPFNIDEILTPQSERGVYTKTVNMPGAGLIQLPTVVVDATSPSSSHDSASNGYETLTLYSCATILGVTIHELNFLTASKVVDNATLNAMEDTARSAGVEWDPSRLSRVDHSTC
eukprot:m.361921 g.361921  ORF g.361921 m.361921 type:complete len:797 (+) comp19985_c0_seq1:76-2466(+)